MINILNRSSALASEDASLPGCPLRDLSCSSVLASVARALASELAGAFTESEDLVVESVVCSTVEEEAIGAGDRRKEVVGSVQREDTV